MGNKWMMRGLAFCRLLALIRFIFWALPSWPLRECNSDCCEAASVPDAIISRAWRVQFSLLSPANCVFFFCSACWSHNPAGGSLRAWRQTAKNKNLLHIFTPAVRAHADNMLQLQVPLEYFKTKRVSSCDSPLSSPPLSFTFQGAQITSSSATVRLMESRSCDLRLSVSPLTSRFFFYLPSRRFPPPALCWTLSAELTERHVGSAAEKLKCNFKGVFDVFFFFPALHLTSCFLLAPASLQLWAVFLSLLLFVRVFREVCLLLWRV